MKTTKKLCSLILALVMLFSVFSPLGCVLQAGAETVLSEVRFTSSTTSVQPGNLPEYTVSSSTASVKSIAEYHYSDSYWARWGENDTAWQGYGTQAATAVGDGKTHYAMSIVVHLKDGYAFNNQTKIIFNGSDVTFLGHTMIKASDWGGRIYIDLGTAGAEIPKCTLTFQANGGTGTMSPITAYQGEQLHLPDSRFTPPTGKSFLAWQIGNKQYEENAAYTPTGNVTVKPVWTDIYIRESRATMTPSSISNAMCANDLVFTSSEPSKYTVSLWRVFDLTNSALNTDDLKYPVNKKFVEGHQYAIEFEFTASGNYYQYDEIKNTSTFYLNGVETDMSDAVFISGSRYRRVILTANAQAISAVSATVTQPVAGGSLNNKPVINTADVTFGAYDWYENGSVLLKSQNKFQAGHTYKLKIRANTVKAFAGTVSATINGKTATVEDLDNNSVMFWCEFTIPGNAGFTVSFNANGGSGSMAGVSGVSGSYTLPACGFSAPSGKEFKCWSVGGVEKAVGATINVTANTVVTAVWKEKHQHNYNQVMCNADYHWYECACGDKVSFGEHVYDNAADTTCNVCGYIRKIAATGYTVTFYSNGGSGSMQSVSNVKDSYTLPVCAFIAPAGQKFSAWAIGSPTGPQCMANTKINVTANTSVYAIWVASTHTHQFALEVFTVTCTDPGYDLYTCTCGYSYKENEVPALGHLFENEYIYSAEPTDIGYTQHTCANCGLVEMFNYTAPTGKPTLKCAARTATAEKLIWNRVDTANGYQIQISNAAGTAWATYATLKNPALNAYVFKNLAAGTNYKFRVRFYISVEGKNYFSPWSAIASPTLPAGTTVKASAGVKSFTAQWSRKAVTGYQIQYSLKTNFAGAKAVTIKNAKTYKYALKNLKAKTNYYVRIRTYKTIGKVNYFSAWSSAVKVKTK